MNSLDGISVHRFVCRNIRDFYVRLPNGERVSLRAYVSGWRKVFDLVKRGEGHVQINGWSWGPLSASAILAGYRVGMNDRISQAMPGYKVGKRWSDTNLDQRARLNHFVQRVIETGEIPPSMPAHEAKRVAALVKARVGRLGGVRCT